jgi:hypothetical protein
MTAGSDQHPLNLAGILQLAQWCDGTCNGSGSGSDNVCIPNNFNTRLTRSMLFSFDSVENQVLREKAGAVWA